MNISQTEMINSLRGLADFLESRPLDLTGAYFSTPELYLFCNSSEEFLSNVKRLGGFKREFNEYYAQAIKRFGDIRLIVNVNRQAVCERVKVGVEVRPAEPERVIAAVPERIVDKYEYKCPESLLSGEN